MSAPIPVSSPPHLIVNPRSFRASRGKLAAAAIALARKHGAGITEATEPAELVSALRSLLASKPRHLFVLAGDGTVQTVVQFLAQLPPGDWLPDLLLLGGGRSNTIARDFGGVPALAKLEAALRRCRHGKAFAVDHCRLLRIEQQGTQPQHGFLFAGASIDSGIRHCRQHRMSGDSWLHKGPLADPYCLSKVAVRTLLGRNPLPPHPQLEILTSEGIGVRGPTRVLLATTLLHREGPYNPYAVPARADGIRVTAIMASARRFWWHLPRVLAGRFSRDMNVQEGYLSGSYDHVDITGLGSYCLDGEMFATDPARPVTIRAGIRLRILVP